MSKWGGLRGLVLLLQLFAQRFELGPEPSGSYGEAGATENPQRVHLEESRRSPSYLLASALEYGAGDWPCVSCRGLALFPALRFFVFGLLSLAFAAPATGNKDTTTHSKTLVRCKEAVPARTSPQWSS